MFGLGIQELVLLFMMLIMPIIYFLPFIIAILRSHDQKPALFALNLFAGWTLIGWVGALVWALWKRKA